MRPYEELIVDIPNYPKPGVVFKDLTPAFADADAFAAMVDDLVATGGTTTAMVRLVRASGARLVGFGFVVELAFLDPRAVIAAETDAEVFSLVAVD